MDGENYSRFGKCRFGGFLPVKSVAVFLKLIFLGAAVLLIFGIFRTDKSEAAINKAFNYQAKLLDKTSGDPVSDGDYDITFRIFDAESSGTCLWSARGSCGTPTARTVTVNNGIFSVMLGDTVAGDNAMTIDFSTDSYYLSVKVGSDSEMSPRKRIGSVPQAFNANNLIGDGAISLTSSTTTGDAAAIAANSLTSGNGLLVSSTSLSSGALLNLSVNGTAAASNSQKALNISLSGANGTSTQSTYGLYISNVHTGTGSTNVGLYASASGGTNNYAGIFENGYVGIGTTAPVSVFNVGSGKIVLGDQDIFGTGNRIGIKVTNTSTNAGFQAGQDSTHNITFGWDPDATAANAHAFIESYGGNNNLGIQRQSIGNTGIGISSSNVNNITSKLAVGGGVAIGANYYASTAPSNGLLVEGYSGFGTNDPDAFLHIKPTIADSLQIDPYGVSAGNTGEFRLMELAANGTNYVGFKSPDAITTSLVWTLPNADGSDGQVLKTNGTGGLSWVAASGAGTINTGADGYLAFYSGAGTTIDDTAGLLWDSTNERLGIGTAVPAYVLDVTGVSRTNQLLADNVNLGGSATGTVRGASTHSGYLNFSGGISTGGVGTGGTEMAGQAVRITNSGNLTNIGSIQSGTINSTWGGTFATAVVYDAGEYPEGAAIGDFNGDRYNDFAVVTNSGANIAVFVNDGDGTFAEAVEYASTSSSQSLATGDMDSDGDIDIVVATTSSVSVFKNNGDGTFSTVVDYSGLSGSYPTVCLGDINNDGSLDVITNSTSTDKMATYLNNGDGTLQDAIDYTTNDQPWGATTADFNGDGFLDAAVSHYNSNYASVFINDGAGTFASKVDYAVNGIYGCSIATADFDLDGDSDLVVDNNSTIASVLMNNGDGTFATAVDYTVVTAARGIATGDLNGDGYPDMASLSFASAGSKVSALLNNGDGTFAAKVDYSVGKSSFGLAIGDFNQDGKNDIVASNSNGTSNSVSVLINQAVTMLYADAKTGKVGIASSSPDFGLDVSGNVRIESSNYLYFGGTGDSDNDVNLYRSAADTLKTDDTLVANYFQPTTGFNSSDGTAGLDVTCGTNKGLKSVVVKDGLITSGICTTNDLTDLAENFGSDDSSLEAGEIVAASSEVEASEVSTDSGMATKGFIERATFEKSGSIIGVVSTNPEITMGESIFSDGENPKPIALSGRVPVLVSSENGAIKNGDLLTISKTIPGVAMKADESSLTTIGTALNDFDSENVGKIIVFVNVVQRISTTSEGDLVGLSEKVAMIDSRVSALETSIGGLDIEKLNNISNIFEISNGDFMNVRVLASMMIKGKLEVSEDSEFLGDIRVSGFAIFNRDSAGRAKIPAGQTRVRVNFENSYPMTPVVNLTPNGDSNIQYRLLEVTPKGFLIEIGEANAIETIFNWSTTAVDLSHTVTVLTGEEGENLRIFAEASYESAIVGSIPAGTTIKYSSRGGGYFRISYRDIIGYIEESFVRENE